MAYTSVTNSFSNGVGNTIDATEVNQNFTDLVNGLSDGSKDLNMSAGTFASTLTANGDVYIGNATSDTLTITARTNTDFVPSTDIARDLGTSALRFKAVYISQITIKQDTADAEFMVLDGTSAGDKTKNVSTLGTASESGSVSVGAPPAATWTFTGLYRVNVEGTDRWVPYYT